MDNFIYEGKLTIKKIKRNGRVKSIKTYKNNGDLNLFRLLCKVLSQDSLQNKEDGLTPNGVYGVKRETLPTFLNIKDGDLNSLLTSPISYLVKYPEIGASPKVVIKWNLISSNFKNIITDPSNVKFQLLDNTTQSNLLAEVDVQDYTISAEETHQIIWEMSFKNAEAVITILEEGN